MSDLFDEIINRIEIERKKQDKKWGSLPRATNSNGIWALIFLEEIGEAAKDFLQGKTIEAEEELIQVATVTVAWIEDSIIKRYLKGGTFTKDE